MVYSATLNTSKISACDFLKVLLVLKKAVVNNWLNGTTGYRDIKHHHAEQVNSSTHALYVTLGKYH